jgi:hypothetical protein
LAVAKLSASTPCPSLTIKIAHRLPLVLALVF